MVQKKKSKKKKTEKAGEPPLQEDVLQRFRLREKSKTLSAINLRRRSSTESQDPYDSDASQPFERKQSSFRKRINSFIQNSPFLKRTAFLRQTSLKNDVSRLSDSLESLTIDENRVVGTEPKGLKILDEARKLNFRKGKSKSCDQFRLSTSSLSDFVNCSLCVLSEGSRKMDWGDRESLKSLPAQGSDSERSFVRRSFSLQTGIRKWSCIVS